MLSFRKDGWPEAFKGIPTATVAFEKPGFGSPISIFLELIICPTSTGRTKDDVSQANILRATAARSP